MYTKSITRKNRTLFVLAIDQSGSMAGELKIGSRRLSKAEMVVEVVNDLISELVERSRRSEGVRNYYDVAIVGYSGSGVRLLLGDDKWVSITDLAESCIQEREVEREYKLSSGEIRLFRHHVRSWISPEASGSTPMYEAMLLVRDIVDEWCSQPENYDSFPPIIYNITDGESTDCDYDDIAEISSKIKAISTHDGQTLLFNIHIASASADSSLLFPTFSEIAQWSECSRSALSLFHAASTIPDIFRSSLSQIKGVESAGEFKAMSFNCSPVELITILNIGSISVKCR